MRRSSDARSSPSMYSIGDVRGAVDLADVIHAAHVRVRDLARQAHFAVEPGEQPRIARCCLGQELERDGLLQLEIGRAIDLAHATAPDEADDPIAVSQERAGREPAFADLARRSGGCGIVDVVRRGTSRSSDRQARPLRPRRRAREWRRRVGHRNGAATRLQRGPRQGSRCRT